MFAKVRNRIEGDEGFTLIELLVVILIIGILAAIAIPSFLNQREKGQDACAKSMARTMQTAAETYFIDNNTYVGMTVAGLTAIEDQIQVPPCGAGTTLAVGLTASVGAASAGGVCGAVVPTAGAYCVSATSAATSAAVGTVNHSFSVERSATGVITRRCGPTSKGACVSTGLW